MATPVEEKEDPYTQAARLTIELVRHPQAPDNLTDAIIFTLAEMGDESKVNIWLLDFGLCQSALALLFRKYKTGAGRRRAFKFANYEIEREKIPEERHSKKEKWPTVLWRTLKEKVGQRRGRATLI